MGRFRDWWLGTKSTPYLPVVPTAPVTYETPNPNPLVVITSMGQEVRIDIDWIRNLDPASLFRSQPYLRAVISFLGRNIAQLGLGVYLRQGDEEREKASDSTAASLLRSPNPYMTRYELFDALVCDLALWDRGYWWVRPDTQREVGWRIDPLPVAWVQDAYGGNVIDPDTWWVTQPGKPTREVPAKQIIHFHGWNPSSLSDGTPPTETLKAILEEQIAAVIYRGQRWERGARVGTVITRPADAPKWSQEAEARFRTEWSERYSGRHGTEAGGTPILQDGMTLSRIGFSAVEDEFVAAAKLALTTVASVYHVNPTMLGLLDNANYSNVREFRRMLYGDTLGPWLSMLEGRINNFLLPMIGEPANEYVEFNIAEKLQGSFEEQAQVASMAVGGPYMTRNEYRARQNLPPIEGGDELIVPLNVIEGGQPSPQTPLSAPAPMRLEGSPRNVADRPAERISTAVLSKYRATDRQIEATRRMLERFYGRQSAVVLTALNNKRDDPWWNEDRWNEELTADIMRISAQVTDQLGNRVLGKLDMPEPFDMESVIDYLTDVMRYRAEQINETTRAQIEDCLNRAGEENAPQPKDVFTTAATSRADLQSISLTTVMAGIAMVEAGKQSERQVGGKATKTWRVTSKNSRHPNLNNETVDIDSKFSNGADWPGDANLGPDQTSGCKCDLVIINRH